uniref:MLX interacting protein n=2 Tax=Leptobrachium leishanense TaxID=445787 RepID=A0A8C5LNK8_9ANUR
MMAARALPAVRALHPRAMVKEEPDDDSDTDEPVSVLKKPDCAEAQIIHSGHFMVSSPHSEHPPKKGYDFDTVNEQACQTYSFGKTSTCHLSIDASLTKLLECMTLAYSGKLVSPKWKNFKGLKLQWRDKIRLNNAIWRAWYMQSDIQKRQNPVCHFVTPLEASVDFDEPRRPEAIATEGKYWKRRIEIVVREYHKWRTYFKKRLQKHKDEDLSILVKDDDVVPWYNSVDGRDTPVPMEEETLLDMEMLMAEISDTLFSTISSHQHNPKEMEYAGNADMIQPDLFPLHPNLDLMDTIESFPDILSFSRLSSLYPSTSSASSVHMSDAGMRPCSHALQPPAVTSTLTPVNLGEELIPSPGPPSIVAQVPEVKRERAASLGSIPRTHGPVRFNSETSVSSQHGLVPVFPPSVTLFQNRSDSPTVPPNTCLAPQSSALRSDADKFKLCSNSVITHTASATLTQNPAATTFSQSQNLILTTQQQVPCNISLQPAGLAPQNTHQTHTYFAISNAGAKQKKQPQKIVPAPPQTETVSLLFTPASFPGQAQAVIVSPAPLKADGMLAPRITQPSVVIAQAGIASASAVAEFHSGILVGSTQQSQGSQKSQPRIFPNLSPEPLVKREKTPKQTSSSGPSPSSCRDCHNSRQGSPCASEHSLSPPHSSGKSTSDSHSFSFKNQRLKHISAEQKRRFNIKVAFTTLNNFVSSSTKPISHAITLQKTVEHIAKLQQERAHVLEETRRLREEVEELNVAINSCQQQLPATGVPVAPQRFDHMRDLYEKYVKSRTLQNWKFWIFSIIIKPLFESFNDMVSTASIEEMYNTTREWLDLHCSLPSLRPKPVVLQTWKVFIYSHGMGK